MRPFQPPPACRRQDRTPLSPSRIGTATPPPPDRHPGSSLRPQWPRPADVHFPARGSPHVATHLCLSREAQSELSSRPVCLPSTSPSYQRRSCPLFLTLRAPQPSG